MAKKILFICTGNYYRSRFAEILFNHLAQQSQIEYRAYSRGLQLWDGNEGPLSRHTIKYMNEIEVDISTELRFPISVSLSDFKESYRVIAMDEQEHRKLMSAYFPALENFIEYWNFADDYIESPDLVLPDLEKKIKDFVSTLKNG